MEAPKFEVGKTVKKGTHIVRIEEAEPSWLYVLSNGEFAFEHELEEVEEHMVQGWTYRCSGEEFGEHGVYENKDEAIQTARSRCRYCDYFVIGEVVPFPVGTKLKDTAKRIYITNSVEEVT